ncbi:hypothetical protein [Flavobacterium sp. XS2P39]|uniref:hypothetical protein n=1 Tax=Flavobacterium sp. XS2P39 TaxID=3401725 RepID=UPI003AAFEBBA
MKKLILSFVFLTTCLLSLPLFSQIENEPVALGLPGDNLNLYAVLDIFQKSKTVEEFERAINSKGENINNLDLNNDNFIDYIRVISYRDGDSYSIVLRVAINSVEDQDVAVIEVNKNRYGRAVVQIIGDEELYGRDYIVEPSAGDDLTPNPGYLGYERMHTGNYWNGILYVNDWPIIVHLLSPSFAIYISPWRWGYYPSYWRPWSPIYYYNYWGYHRHYYSNYFYRRVGYIRYPHAHSYYHSRRTSSPIVRRNRVNDSYRETYQGRNYRRPEGTVLPRTREAFPERRTRTRQAPETRSVRPNAPLRRQSIEGGRDRMPSTTRPGQPNAPTRRQPIDGVRPATRPAPNAPTRRQSMEGARPTTRPAPSAPMNRQAAPRGTTPTRRDRN